MQELLEQLASRWHWLTSMVAQPSQFSYIDFGRTAMLMASLAYLTTVLFGVLGQVFRDRRWVTVSRRGIYVGALATVSASVALIACFVKDEFAVDYVYSHSETRLGYGHKLCGLWAGLEGSILFWAMLTGVAAALVALFYRRDRQHPVARRMEPNVYIVLGVVLSFFAICNASVADPFLTLQEHYGERFTSFFSAGVPKDGLGLNPQLESYWMKIHPPCLYIGWVLYTVPFAYAVASLITNEQGSYWVRKTRLWMMVAWMFNSVGIVLGSVWAYEVLGWGGYWGWDAVENASFLPWFSATAFLHSIMLQERRDMARVWNTVLCMVTFLLCIFGTYLTRSGIVASVHAFAGGKVGDWFQWFLLCSMIACAGLVGWRAFGVRRPNRIESPFSREAVFVVNNMVLLALAAMLVTLTMLPKISTELFGGSFSAKAPLYNTYMNPFFVLMLALTAVGPAFGWVRTSARNFRRNFLIPAALAFPCAGGIQWLAYHYQAGEGIPLTAVEHLYPTFLVNYFSTVIVATVVAEFLRAWRSRRRRRADENALGSALEILTLNHRRYGGYIVHIGLALMAIGIVNSAMMKAQYEVKMSVGDVFHTGDYDITLTAAHGYPTTRSDRQAYLRSSVELELREDGVSTRLEPETRYYPVTQEKGQPHRLTQVAIQRGIEDLWVYYQGESPQLDRNGRLLADQVPQTEFLMKFIRRPFVNAMWLGIIVMLLGALWAALPMGRKSVGLTD